MPRYDIIPVAIGSLVMMGITEYHRYKTNQFYNEAMAKQREEIEKMYRKYVKK